MKNKYPISKEFGFFRYFIPPINRPMLAMAAAFTSRPPSFLFKDRELSFKKHKIDTLDGGKMELYEIYRNDASDNSPCLIYYHGGGFIFEGAAYHFRLCMEYAKRTPCKVIYVKYRLCPKHPFPIPQEDSYLAYKYICENAERLGIDKQRIGIGGDSAGGQISAIVALRAREDSYPVKPLFQLLIYPFLDMRNDSESAKKFSDTPMWNSSLSLRIYPLLNPNGISHSEHFLSPCEVSELGGLPRAYIQTAEFDCLRDDGALYHKRLSDAGVCSTLDETKGTMHGFDIVLSSPITRAAVDRRIEFMKNVFCNK